jgi:hypothetical protein
MTPEYSAILNALYHKNIGTGALHYNQNAHLNFIANHQCREEK